MHIRTVAAIAAAAVLAIAPGVMPSSSAHAQGIASFGIAAGASVPTGDFADINETGFHATVAIGSQPPLFPLGFRAEGSYHQFAGKERGGLLGGGNFADQRILNVTGNVILTAPGILARPYLIGGVGYYNVKADVGNAEAEGKVGFNVGIGGKFSLTGFSTFAELRFHTVSTDGNSTAFIPVTFGIMF